MRHPGALGCRPCSPDSRSSLQRSPAIRIREILLAILLFSPFILLVGGGIAMCFLYAPGERLDARGYWILGIMVVPYFLMMTVTLIW